MSCLVFSYFVLSVYVMSCVQCWGKQVLWTLPNGRSIIGFITLYTGTCVFSHKTALLFHGPPRSLRRVVVAKYCETSHEANFVSYVWQGATPSIPSIPARRLEPRMKHVLKPWGIKNKILCHLGQTLGSAGMYMDIDIRYRYRLDIGCLDSHGVVTGLL